MSPTTLLLADDDAAFLATKKEWLERQGYLVLQATSPEEARRVLMNNQVDVAILDLRLRNSRDATDTSGLDIAREVAPHVPKIIISDFGSFEEARSALETQLDGLPIAVSFVRKKDPGTVLLSAIEKALSLAPRFQRSLDSLASKIDGDYDEAGRHSRYYFILSIAFSIGGLALLLLTVYFALTGRIVFSVVAAVIGVIGEAAALLAFKRFDISNERMDRYHNELLQIRQLDILLAACSGQPASSETECRQGVITKAADRWFKIDGSDGTA